MAIQITKLLDSDKTLSLAGTWVWAAGRELDVDSYIRLRCTFTIPSPPAPSPSVERGKGGPFPSVEKGIAKAAITVANAGGEYELWVNGQWAGRGGTPSTPEVHYADVHRIKRLLQPGANTIAILAHGYGSGGQWWAFSPSGIVAEVKVDGKVVAATAGPGPVWKATPAPEFSRRAHRFLFFLGFAEIVDMRDEQPDWTKPEFDDFGWPEAEPCTQLGSHAIIPREVPLPRTAYFPAKPSGAGKWMLPGGVQSIYLPPIVKQHGPGRYRLASFVMSPGVEPKLHVAADADYSLKINDIEVAHRYGGEEAMLDRYTEPQFRGTRYDALNPPEKVRLEPGWNEVVFEIDATERTAHVSLVLMHTFWMASVMPAVFSAAKKLDEPGWIVEKLSGPTPPPLPLPKGGEGDMAPPLPLPKGGEGMRSGDLCVIRGAPPVAGEDRNTIPLPTLGEGQGWGRLFVRADGHVAEVHSAWDISLSDRGVSGSRAGKLPKKDVVIEPGRYAIFDLGRVMSGRPAIEATAPTGAVLDLQYAEWITDYDKPLQAAGERYVDRVTWREGRHERQTVARRGVRFIKIFNRGAFLTPIPLSKCGEGNPLTPCPLSKPGEGEDRPAPLSTLGEGRGGEEGSRGGEEAVIHRVRIGVEKVVGKPTGTFQCSDERLNTIHRVSLDTLDISLNYQPVDCATRENGQYPGDAYVQAFQFFYNYPDLRLLRKGIRQFPRVQEPNGRFSGMTPAEWRHTLTDYCLIWVSWIADYYRHTGDVALVREMLPYAGKLFRFFRDMKAHHGLLARTSEEHFWVFLDHSPIHKRGLVCGYNAWYARALEDAAFLANVAGQPELEREYAAEASEIRQTCRRIFWDADAGLYRDCWTNTAGLSPSITFQTNVIAIFTGLATDEQLASMPAMMWRPDGSKIQPELAFMNPYFQHFVLEAMAKAGKHEWALAFLRSYWGLMLDCGATTTWEVFQSTGPTVPASSLCHPWSGAPAYWLPAYVLGVRCAGPGWSKAVVRPLATAGIDWAKGTVPTPRGPISVEWHRKDGAIELTRCETPEGVEVMR
ncbi:MAG TPA: family 78 glycoside hydrolase catalytic domain [Planctomycetota bacterium]|nr:family 78 glycoside hydrolase catalytic domain [Planctomycetota bacterium]